MKAIFPIYTGESPDCDDCTFPVCPGGDSCTKQTKYAVHPWLGSGPEFTIGEKKTYFTLTQIDAKSASEESHVCIAIASLYISLSGLS